MGRFRSRACWSEMSEIRTRMENKKFRKRVLDFKTYLFVLPIVLSDSVRQIINYYNRLNKKTPRKMYSSLCKAPTTYLWNMFVVNVSIQNFFQVKMSIYNLLSYGNKIPVPLFGARTVGFPWNVLVLEVRLLRRGSVSRNIDGFIFSCYYTRKTFSNRGARGRYGSWRFRFSLEKSAIFSSLS